MKIVQCEQGSREWILTRIGIPTASQFHRIITPKTQKLSASADGYMHELLAEWMLQASLDEKVTAWMERGSDMEEHAVKYYELIRNIDTDQVGHILLDDGSAGCSPDRLCGSDGGLELKSPSAGVHVGYLLNMTEKFNCQTQGSMWIAEREWWDFLSYYPGLPEGLHRFYRDEPFIKKLKGAVAQFNERMEEAKETLIKKGYVERQRKAS